MSCGSGTRLLPLSRKNKPKQFLRLFGDRSLFQNTLTRLFDLSDIEAPIVVCNENHRFMVAEQLQEITIPESDILLEPCARNTAPAIALAALQALGRGDDPLILVLAADHLIQDVDVFHTAIKQAQKQAETGKLVTFGIVPTMAHTGYGYIQAKVRGEVSAVDAFVEKPDAVTAQGYLDSGHYYWNSGMLMFKASTIIAELERFSPKIISCCRTALTASRADLDFIRIEQVDFEGCPSDSLDYAVMEKTDKAVVIPLDAGWSDVCSWSSLWENHSQDQQQNVLIGDVLVHDVQDAYIHS